MITISDIKPYEKNAKAHPAAQVLSLAQIVREMGWRQPVLVNQEGIVIVGHGRLEAWYRYKDEMNLDPIWIMDDKGQTIHGAPATKPLTIEQERAYRLADNKLNESEWIMDLVRPELELMSFEMRELSGFGKLNLKKVEFNAEIGGEKSSRGTIECPGCHLLFDPRERE